MNIKAKGIDPVAELEKVLRLISRDLSLIEETSSEALDDKTALTLTRYGSFLSELKKNREKDALDEKKEVSKLSTDQLIELYKKQKE